MSSHLTVRRSHLNDNRRLLIGRSIAAALAGAIPVPALDSWLASTIMRSSVRRIASHHHIDVNPAGVEAVADGPSQPPKWTQLAGSAIVLRILSRSWRRVVLTYLATQRARAAAKYFSLGTLFDHYCAKLHIGLGIDATRGETIHRLMQQAIDETPGALGTEPFRRGIAGLGKAALRTPFEILNFTSRGALRRLLTRDDEVQAVEHIDHALEVQDATKSGILGKTTAKLEMELAPEVNSYLERLISTFELLWHQHQNDNPPPDSNEQP